MSFVHGVVVNRLTRLMCIDIRCITVHLHQLKLDRVTANIVASLHGRNGGAWSNTPGLYFGVPDCSLYYYHEWMMYRVRQKHVTLFCSYLELWIRYELLRYTVLKRNNGCKCEIKMIHGLDCAFVYGHKPAVHMKKSAATRECGLTDHLCDKLNCD